VNNDTFSSSSSPLIRTKDDRESGRLFLFPAQITGIKLGQHPEISKNFSTDLRFAFFFRPVLAGFFLFMPPLRCRRRHSGTNKPKT